MPTAGDKDQLTSVFVLPVTVVENCLDSPPESDAVAGDSDRETTGGGGAAWSEMVELADFVESATLTALILTVCGVVMLAGAV